MSKTRIDSDAERLKTLELKLAECLGEAGNLGLPMAATLIGAALEETGSRLEQELGVSQPSIDMKVRFDN
jgi:hypothetical protein